MSSNSTKDTNGNEVCESQKVALKDTLVSLLPGAFEATRHNKIDHSIKVARTASGDHHRFDADEPTLSESNAQAYRADMVADSAGTTVICEHLQLLLDPNDHIPSPTDPNQGFVPRHHSTSEDTTDTTDTDVPLVKHINMFTKSTSDLLSHDQNPRLQLHKTASAPSDIQHSQDQDTTIHLTIPQQTKNSTKRAIPPTPEILSTEPSLFLQAADATGAAWYGEDDTCRPPKTETK